MSAPRLATGHIIWAEITDANGIRKLRPAVIVAPTEQIIPQKPFDVVAVSSRLTDPLPDDHVLLPWHRDGHPRTGLNRRCAAVCTWLNQIVDSDIQDVAGMGSNFRHARNSCTSRGSLEAAAIGQCSGKCTAGMHI